MKRFQWRTLHQIKVTEAGCYATHSFDRAGIKSGEDERYALCSNYTLTLRFKAQNAPQNKAAGDISIKGDEEETSLEHEPSPARAHQ